MDQLRFTAVLVCVLAVLTAGVWLGGHPEHLPGGVRDALVNDDVALQSEVKATIRENFYKRVSDDELEEFSLDGMVRGLNDRFSGYLDPEEARRFNQSLGGDFSGVGMSVESDRRGLRVLAVYDGTPAKRAKIRPGDLITEVDGNSIAGDSTDAATSKIKGPEGTKVRLRIVEPKARRSRVLTLTRQRIEIPVAESEIARHDGERFGVVRLLGFSSGAHAKLRREVRQMLDRGAKGIVLDLRGNGGGLLQEGVLVSSLFVEDGVIVSTKGRTRSKRVFRAIGKAISERVPVVVLVDRGTASASEIVTGALRDHRRATVVGEKTFGKGVFQEVEPLSNGGAIDLTVGQYFLPGGENISDKGIKPSVRAKDEPRTERRDEALPVALRVLAAKAR